MRAELFNPSIKKIIVKLSQLKGLWIVQLNLSKNRMSEKKFTDLAVLLSMLKAFGVTYLNLHFNNLGQKTGTELDRKSVV